MTRESNLTVGVYQPEARVQSPEERLIRLETIFDEPAARECDLIVCPELFLSGYFVDGRILEWAEASDGPFSRGVCEIARSRQCAIVYGYPERTTEGVFNSALCTGPDGCVVANHRKNLLPHDYEEKYFRTGREPTIFQVKGWKIGLLICYETEFPESVRYYAQSGCDLVVAPTALTVEWSVVSQRVVPSRAFENTFFLVYANHAGEENGYRYLGESVVVSPFGKDLARAGNTETVISARLRHAEISEARARLHFLEDVGQSCYRQQAKPQRDFAE